MSKTPISDNYLNFDSEYPCPVCLHGQISTIPLMEALACNLCRHIFTLDTNQQSLTMADSSSPLTWQWNGRTWQGIYRNGVELNWSVKLGAIAIVLLPTALIALAAYIFPPIPGSRLSWLPTVWVGLTFLFHLTWVVSLIIEYYQFPIFIYLKVTGQNLLNTLLGNPT